MGFKCVNSVTLIGYLGSDPEIRVLESGVKVAKFNIATNDSYTTKEGVQREHTEWHSVVAWREVASYCDTHLRKGSLTRIEGKIRSFESVEKHSLTTTKVYQIIANTVQMLTDDSNPTTVEPKKSEAQLHSVPIAAAPLDVDGIPF